MKSDSYRDLLILHEVARNSHLTQRDLAKGLGLALGLINLRLQHLSRQGSLCVAEIGHNRIQYLITPKGFLEKERLLSECLGESMKQYRYVRRFLKEQLLALAQDGVRRILLYGTGEMAELAYLTIQEVGLTLAGVVGDGETNSFFNLPVRPISEIENLDFERVIVATLESRRQDSERLLKRGVEARRIISLPEDRMFLQGREREEFSVRESRVVSQREQAGNGMVSNPSATDVVILCGGRGTRLKSLTSLVPKPLLPVGGEPFLLRLLLRLKEEGFRRFILAAHYLPQQFQEFVEANQDRLEEVLLVLEPQALGTGGALRHAVEYVASPTFLVLNGDSWVDQPLLPVLQEHQRLSRDFTVVAVPAAQVEGEALKKGVWRIGPGGGVLGFDTQESVEEGWVNAGSYFLSREMVGSWPVGSYSLETNLPTLLSGRRAGVYCSTGRLLDIGTPQTYGRAGEVLESFTLSERKVVTGGNRS